MLTLLLVDDHTLFRETLAKALKKSSNRYTILEASNGVEALEILKKRHVDLMLLDVQMPIMNGVETFKEVKKIGLKTKVVILTMFGEATLIIHLLKLGVNGFLLKDVGFDELEAAISKTLIEGGCHNDLVRKIMEEYVMYPDHFPSLNLSPREFQVLELIKLGLTNKEMATYLHLEVFTVESYRKTLMDKTKCANTAELVSFAYKIGVNLPNDSILLKRV